MPTQACSSDASYGASRAQKAAQIDQKLRCRPSREDLIQRDILQVGGRLFRCTHEEVSKGSLQWVVRSAWPADHDQLVSRIEEGLGFSIFVTPCGYVYAHGAPRLVEVGELCRSTPSRTKKRCALSHALTQITKKIPVRDAAHCCSHLQESEATKISLLFSPVRHSIRQIACGSSHALVLTQHDSGALEIWSWGDGTFGQLGLGEEHRSVTNLTRITTCPYLVGALAASASVPDTCKVYCGPFMSCLTIAGSCSTIIWMWGRLPSAEVLFIPCSDLIDTSGIRIQDAGLSINEVVFLTDDSGVFSWHVEESCGVPSDSSSPHDAMTMTHVSFRHSNVCISAISSGYEHSLALDADGRRLFTWGSNRLGACGAATKFIDYAHPVLVSSLPNDSTISHIGCKGHTSLCVTSDGRMFTWGVSGIDHANLLPAQSLLLPPGSWPHVAYGGVGIISMDTSFGANTNRSEASLATTRSADESIVNLRILGISVTSAATGIVTLNSLHWRIPKAFQLRVFTMDSIVFLVGARSKDEQLVVRNRTVGAIEQRLTAIQLSTSTGIAIDLYVVEMLSAGAFALARDVNGFFVDILAIDCCLRLADRDCVLKQHRKPLRRFYREAIASSGADAHSISVFSAYLVRCLQHPTIRLAIAWSPLASTMDEEVVKTWDIDRSSLDMAHRHMRYSQGDPQLPLAFVMWHEELMEDVEHDPWPSPHIEGLSLWDLLLQQLTITLSALELVFIAVANHPVHLDSHPDGKAPPEFATEEQNQVIKASGSVQFLQTPLEFLVQGSRSMSSLLSQEGAKLPDRYETHSHLAMWSNERGELFYSDTTLSGVGIVQFLAPPSQNAEDERSCTKFQRFQRRVNAFLWEQMNSRRLSISTLHSFLTLPDQSSQSGVDSLILGLNQLGFSSPATTTEEWFTFLTMLQSISPGRTNQALSHSLFTASSLKTFLVDPFHTDFWRVYLADCHVALTFLKKRRPRTSMRDLLVQCFPNASSMSWRTFVSCFEGLHNRLSWAIEPSDICRVLYRFDLECSGDIAADQYCHALLKSMNGSSKHATPVGTDPVRVAMNAHHRRPDVRAFATPSAVRKLFRSRSQVDEDIVEAQDTTRKEMVELRHIGNSRLARIRNLPVSQLISEGIYFRPPSTSFRVPSSSDDAS